MTPRQRPLTALLLVLSSVTLAMALKATASLQVSRSRASSNPRLEEMRHHFADVLLVHLVVIPGDLPALRQPAL